MRKGQKELEKAESETEELQKAEVEEPEKAEAEEPEKAKKTTKARKTKKPEKSEDEESGKAEAEEPEKAKKTTRVRKTKKAEKAEDEEPQQTEKAEGEELQQTEKAENEELQQTEKAEDEELQQTEKAENEELQQTEKAEGEEAEGEAQQTEAEKEEPEEEIQQTDTDQEKNKVKYKKKPKEIFGKLIKRAISPLTDLLHSVDTDYEDRSHIKKTFISMLKLRVPICILLVVVNLAAGFCFILKSEATVTTEMSLNYEESANGLNPNSTRFNVYDIASQEVVEGMLEYCGIDPDSVDLDAVINSISIRPTNSKAFSEESLFISTSYKVTITKPSCLKNVSTQDLMTFLGKSYKDNLYSKYTENRSILDFDIEEFNDVEFMEIADLLDLKAQQIEKYLNTRVKQSKTFTEQESDETFKSLSQKAEDLRSYDIAKYRAFVIQSGTSHDKARYIRALEYTNQIKGLSYAKDMAAYDVRNDGIKMYDDAMISVVMIPSIDESKNTYYMSKTKTGMDYMASQADDYLLTAQETEKEIATNKDIIAKMDAGKNSAADVKRAGTMIEEIRLKFSELSKQIEIVDKAYIKYKTKDYLTFKTASPSFVQQIGLSTLVVISAVMLLGIFFAIWIRFRYFGGGKKSEGISITTIPFKG